MSVSHRHIPLSEMHGIIARTRRRGWTITRHGRRRLGASGPRNRCTDGFVCVPVVPVRGDLAKFARHHQPTGQSSSPPDLSRCNFVANGGGGSLSWRRCPSLPQETQIQVFSDLGAVDFPLPGTFWLRGTLSLERERLCRAFCNLIIRRAPIATLLSLEQTFA
jgi:hypothetical protein